MSFKKLRKSKKVGQRQISDALHCHQSLISKWENGVCQPSINSIPEIAEVLKCSVEDVVMAFCAQELKQAKEQQQEEA
ncbi:MAG: helix-turn-helix transcriptional regulator [Clostridiales bacterium]|nr:helix-turn-helix transcriptional regulator [Clostridiales bacterium]